MSEHESAEPGCCAAERTVESSADSAASQITARRLPAIAAAQKQNIAKGVLAHPMKGHTRILQSRWREREA